MHKNSKVMPIFRRSSGILKTVMSLFIMSAPGLTSFALECGVCRRFYSVNPKRRLTPHSKDANDPARVSLLGWTGFHFVSFGLLARRNKIRAAALGFDLLQCGLGKMMRFDDQLLRHLAVAEDANAVGRAVGQPRLAEGFLID